MKISITREPSIAVAAINGDVTDATATEFQQCLVAEASAALAESH